MPAVADAAVATVRTPAGPFTVVADVGGRGPATVLAAGWTGDVATLLPLITARVRPLRWQQASRIDGVTDAVLAYHDGDLAAVDRVPVRQAAGPYLDHALAVLRTVPAGAPLSYAAFAVLTGRPAAVRAAASACARNAAALFVPCHRILRTDGTLGGFRWGLPVKRWLLDHESGDQREAALFSGSAAS
ncbi:methylated-DNA--[protein]-cysteine S-methyltransferase [Nakamurella endophytica]|uniref:Methylated-DNA:protein-cysteine methyltransferase n=1 Tax=Nakamurella endophytica TaxID=1748367 RepID=A0A917SMY7_9ACTN|nr:putative methylated-DNA:protein-cysteine methyltransferase [Nakamurella endophytica]